LQALALNPAGAEAAAFERATRQRTRENLRPLNSGAEATAPNAGAIAARVQFREAPEGRRTSAAFAPKPSRFPQAPTHAFVVCPPLPRLSPARKISEKFRLTPGGNCHTVL